MGLQNVESTKPDSGACFGFFDWPNKLIHLFIKLCSKSATKTRPNCIKLKNVFQVFHLIENNNKTPNAGEKPLINYVKQFELFLTESALSNPFLLNPRCTAFIPSHLCDTVDFQACLRNLDLQVIDHSRFSQFYQNFVIKNLLG
jgi:hypothetical protein